MRFVIFSWWHGFGVRVGLEEGAEEREGDEGIGGQGVHAEDKRADEIRELLQESCRRSMGI